MKFNFLFILFLTGAVVEAQVHKFQTVFILGFTKYVQWPDNNVGESFEISVLGDGPIIEELRQMAINKKTADNKVIKVKHLNTIEELKNCHILFITAKNSDQLHKVIAYTEKHSILIVTEDHGMAAKGSSINFVVKDGKLAFELNQAAITKNGLKISSTLSKLAIPI